MSKGKHSQIHIPRGGILRFRNETTEAVRLKIESGEYGTILITLAIGDIITYEPAGPITPTLTILDAEQEVLEGDDIIDINKLTKGYQGPIGSG